MAVHPDRSYGRGGRTQTKGDAVLVDLGGGKNLVALLAHIDGTLDLDGMNYVALRAFRATGRNVSFNEMSRLTGAVPVTGALIPVLVSFADLGNPGSARTRRRAVWPRCWARASVSMAFQPSRYRTGCGRSISAGSSANP